MRRRTLLKLPIAISGASALRTRNPFVGGSLVVSAAERRHVAVSLDRSMPLHPRLQYGAVAEPNQRVEVIVQRQNSRSAREVSDRVREAVGKEFSVLPAHTMTVMQRDLIKLAADRGVVYISPATRARLHDAGDPAATLQTRYPLETGATSVWQDVKGRKGSKGHDVVVAVLDTGFSEHPDLKGIKTVDSVDSGKMSDAHGHGTHIAGIIAGVSHGEGWDNKYLGVAPDAKIIGIRVADAAGSISGTNLLQGLEWVYFNHEKEKIRVVNLSLSVGTPESYMTSPLSAAVERLWNAGVVVVASAGNFGQTRNATWYPPGNDPYIITVGALDDHQTLSPSDFGLAFFSSYGPTQDGFPKPDVIAPGRRIVSTLASTTCYLAKQYPDRVIDGRYIRLSGTSSSTAVVSGIVALLLAAYPDLTPNQVKAILTSSAKAYTSMPDKANTVDALAALTLASGGKYGSANVNLTPSTALGGSTDTGGGNATYWDATYWDATYWDATYWDATYWDSSDID